MDNLGKIEAAWERLMRENKISPIAVQYWLNKDKEPVKPPEPRAYCKFELDNRVVVTVPVGQMKYIKHTRWGGENGDITTVYNGYH